MKEIELPIRRVSSDYEESKYGDFCLDGDVEVLESELDERMLALKDAYEVMHGATPIIRHFAFLDFHRKIKEIEHLLK